MTTSSLGMCPKCPDGRPMPPQGCNGGPTAASSGPRRGISTLMRMLPSEDIGDLYVPDRVSQPIIDNAVQQFSVKCGPCELKYGLCAGMSKIPGPYSDFVEDGITVHCNPETGFSVRYQCAFECTELQKGPNRLACYGCSRPVGYSESLGKDCADLRSRYSNGLDVSNPWYAAFWDNLASVCESQVGCTCTPAAQVYNPITYAGRIKLLYTLNPDPRIIKSYGISGKQSMMRLAEY
jgi:hypothetical protein